jgi:steroid 5-alpha reductase family enzyme
LIAFFPLLSFSLPAGFNLKAWLFFLWHFIPSFFQILIFLPSTTLTETISRSKYPAYVVYQKRVGMFLTMPWTLLTGGEEKKKDDKVLWEDGKTD